MTSDAFYKVGSILFAVGMIVVVIACAVARSATERLEQKEAELDDALLTVQLLEIQREAANSTITMLQKDLTTNANKYAQTLSELSELRQANPIVDEWCSSPLPPDVVRILANDSDNNTNP